jgi:hypothetical protein
MKKLLIISILTLTSCIGENKVEPIEKYKGFVVAYKDAWYSKTGSPRASFVTLKSKDSIVNTSVLTFDAERYSVGDTIK